MLAHRNKNLEKRASKTVILANSGVKRDRFQRIGQLKSKLSARMKLKNSDRALIIIFSFTNAFIEYI